MQLKKVEQQKPDAIWEVHNVVDYPKDLGRSYDAVILVLIVNQVGKSRITTRGVRS